MDNDYILIIIYFFVSIFYL